MPTYRYEAITQQHVPIHGMMDADDEDALTVQLSARGLRLVSSTKLSLDAIGGGRMPDLPRLYQLRIGESLREALLTDLPAHDAVRAIAAEPFSHPFLSIFPWIQLAAAVVFAFAGFRWMLSDGAVAIPWISAAGCFVAVPVIWLLAREFLSKRPRRLLHRFADRLESGNTNLGNLVGALPGELQTVMDSGIETTQKARTIAELMPSLLSTGIRNQQFAINIVAPVAMMAVVSLGMYALLAFVVPDFGKIFSDFGTELPLITRSMLDLSSMLSAGGIAAWYISAGVAFAALCLLFWLLTTGRVAELLESVPLLGVGFRWTMQSRVARILAAMIRNGGDYAESIRTATAGSGFQSVMVEGRVLARHLESGSPHPFPTKKLNGLPMSMLTASVGGLDDSEHRRSVAATFDNLADLLQNASVGQGRLFAMFLQSITIVVCAVLVGLGVIAMFLPLIKLLNDLA
ncbi:MAG: hypothetical protein R3C19_00245 [Planctomycetaceae bacterium]